MDVLSQAGFLTTDATDPRTGLEMIVDERPDLVVLDPETPEDDGWTLIPRIRELSEAVPILVASALNTPADRVRALNLGSDDFLGKPFLPSELIARVTALLRRTRQSPGGPAMEGSIQTDWLSIDPGDFRVTANGRPVDLSPQEFRLLILLARRRGRLCRHDDLIAGLWGNAPGVDSRGALTVLVSRLRRRLGPHPLDGRPAVESVRGVGYRLVVRSLSARG